MPRGSSRERMIEIGKNTRFDSEKAAKAQKISAAKKRESAPLKLTMRGVASEAMQCKAPLPEKTLKAIGDFFGIDPERVTVLHVAVYKQGIESMKGNLAALTFMRDMTGEKPAENVTVTAPDTGALDEAFALLAASAGTGGDSDDPPGTGAEADR